jgi:putative ABC transport system permease protein
MLKAALRDLQWRRKRFVITIIGTALVFAMSLLMSGLSDSFAAEANRTLHQQGAEWWVTRADAAGAFSPGSLMTATDIATLTDPSLGFAAAAPVLYGTSTAETSPGEKGNKVIDVTVFGVLSRQLGAPGPVVEGTDELHEGEVVVPRSMGKRVGDSLRIGGTDMTVVGVVEKASLLGGTPTVSMLLSDSQRLLLGGQPFASMVLVRGTASLPSAFRAWNRAEAKADLLRPLENPRRSIDFVKVLLWIVAGLIVASVVYLTVLERTRDIAVFKATGVTNGAIGAGICLQAVIISVAASLLGIAFSQLLTPLFPMEVEIGGNSMVALPVLAVAVGMVAGLIGVSRTARVTPATAFGGP